MCMVDQTQLIVAPLKITNNLLLVTSHLQQPFYDLISQSNINGMPEIGKLSPFVNKGLELMYTCSRFMMFPSNVRTLDFGSFTPAVLSGVDGVIHEHRADTQLHVLSRTRFFLMGFRAGWVGAVLTAPLFLKVNRIHTTSGRF